MKYYVLASLLGFCSIKSFSQSDLPKTDTAFSYVKYGSKGFELTTPDQKFSLQLGGRLQFRYAYPNDQDPISFDDFDTRNRNIFKINRARLKIGGNVYQPWLKYYMEYELAASRLLDFRIMVEKWPWLRLKAGQWKTEYSRERIISSGRQQMMERSIINRPFTIDRQQGVSIYGRLGKGLADFDYAFSALTGNGRGASDNDDHHLMYTGRLQWNLLGDGVPMSGSALSYDEKPQAAIAVAGATNTSQFTRFSSNGGGSLYGFSEGTPGQYTVDQWLLETSFQYHSFSWHSEYHRKQILNNISSEARNMMGYFLQGGFILNHAAAAQNAPLFELAGRYAYFHPDLDMPMNSEEEYSLAANCFFNDHRNKLTADVTLFDFDELSLNREASGWRFRVQYDISF